MNLIQTKLIIRKLLFLQGVKIKFENTAPIVYWISLTETLCVFSDMLNHNNLRLAQL